MRHRETPLNPTPEIHKCFDILAGLVFKMTSNIGNSQRVLGIGQGPNGKGSITKGALTLVQLVEGYIYCENYSVAPLGGTTTLWTTRAPTVREYEYVNIP